MGKGLRASIAAVLAATAMLGLYQNCSSHSDTRLDKLLRFQASGNGESYDGKIVYSHRNPDQACPFDDSQIVSRLFVDDKGTVHFTRLNCIDVAPPKTVAATEWTYGAEDHSIILYKGQNFILDRDAYDPCPTKTAGAPCKGLGNKSAGLFVSEYRNSRYMITPGGCRDSKTPTCDGAIEIKKVWSRKDAIVGINSADGLMNSWLLYESDPTAEAARFCRDLDYGGYTDWYLPSHSEALMVIGPNSGRLPGVGLSAPTVLPNLFAPPPLGAPAELGTLPVPDPSGGAVAKFWTSSEAPKHAGYEFGPQTELPTMAFVMMAGGATPMQKTDSLGVRCLRRY